MALRIFVGDWPLVAGAEFDLPAEAARHTLVRRVQPGALLCLFDGSGADWPAEVTAIGQRGRVGVRLHASPQLAPASELPVAVTLAFGMPANERVDALVEKATELGAAALQPLMSERSVLRLRDERALRRRAHWQAVAASACEQCGRATVPAVHEVRSLDEWLRDPPGAPGLGLVLSTDPSAPLLPTAWPHALGQPARITLLSGPEGGLTSHEESAARARGLLPVSLGRRVLRADTAPLAALAWIALASEARPSAGPSPTPKSS